MTSSVTISVVELLLVGSCCSVFASDPGNESTNNNNNNFGTALYAPSDAVVATRNWTDPEQIELGCRMLVDRLVPKRTPENGDFLGYFDLIKNKSGEIGWSSTRRKRQALVMVADAIGAFLYAKLLPVARMRYYEGKANYSTTKRLHDLMKNIKYVLGTDGRRWARPISAAAASEDYAADKATVAALVTAAGPSPAAEWPRCGGVDAGPYGMRRRRLPDRTVAADYDDASEDPLPFFDDDTRPHSLVVPWRADRPVLYGVRDVHCHRALFDHCARAAAAAAAKHAPPPDGHATAAVRYARDLSAWLRAAVRPLVSPASVAAHHPWYPCLWAARPVMRLLHHAAGAPERGPPPPDSPNVNFYMAIVLASALVFWTAAACVLIAVTPAAGTAIA